MKQHATFFLPVPKMIQTLTVASASGCFSSTTRLVQINAGYVVKKVLAMGHKSLPLTTTPLVYNVRPSCFTQVKEQQPQHTHRCPSQWLLLLHSQTKRKRYMPCCTHSVASHHK
jgi:hypothetical protein